MSINAQDANSAIVSGQTNARPDPVPYAPTPSEQPQWRSGMNGAELEQFRTLRDISINGNIARIVNERRRTGYVPRGEALINPLGVEARVTSLPAESRFHPILREDVAHTGLDSVPVNFEAGTSAPPPVYAASSGTVVYVGKFSERSGNFIMMLDDDNRIISYAHLVEGSTRGIRVGDIILQGQQIALMGNTGPVDRNGEPRLRPHLHFGVRVLGEHGREQSARAQAQRVALASATVQPLDEEMLADPALNYAMYDVIHPPFEGTTYRTVGARIPAPGGNYALVARDVMAAPARTAATEPAPSTPPVSGAIPGLPAGVFGGEPLEPQSPPSWDDLIRRVQGTLPPR